MPTVKEVIGALERRELAISNAKEHLENVENLLKERYKTGNEYLIEIGEKQVEEAKTDLVNYESALIEFKDRVRKTDFSKWLERYLADNPHMTEQDVYDKMYGKLGNNQKFETLGDSAPFVVNVELDNNPKHIHLVDNKINNKYMKQGDYTEIEINTTKTTLIDNQDVSLCKQYDRR